MPQLCGGVGQSKPANAEIQTMCDQLRPDIEAKAGKKFNHFNAHSYSSQVVAGTNYFVKINVGDNEFVHARIHKPLPHTGQPPSVHSVQHPKTEGDAITHF